MAEVAYDVPSNVHAEDPQGTGASNPGAAQPGGTADDWRTGLDPAIASSPALQDIADVGALAAQFVEQQQYLGNAIRPPGPEASEQDRQAFYRKIQEHAPNLIPRPNPEDAEATSALLDALGRPSDAKGYTVPEIEDIDTARFDAAREVFHGVGLTQAQVEALTKWEIETTKEAMAQQQAGLTEQHAELRREWGMTYEPRMTTIGNFVAQTNAPPDLVEAAKSGHLNKATVEWLHGLATAVGTETPNVTTQEGGASNALPPAEAQARADEITKRMISLPPSDPEYAGLQKKRMEYLEMTLVGEDAAA